MKKTGMAPLALLIWAPNAHAQVTDCTTAITNASNAIASAKADTTKNDDAKKQAIRQALSDNLFAACSQAPMSQGTKDVMAKNVEAKRTDVQTGAPAAASGTTTAVSSASKSSFLGLALENGTTTQTTSGTSSTVSINPYKFVRSVADDLKWKVDPDNLGVLLLRQLSLSLTLNSGSATNSKQTSTTTPASTTTSGTTTPATTNLDTLFTQLKEVSDFTVHYDIYNNRDPMSHGAAEKIRTKTKIPAEYFLAAGAIGKFVVDARGQEEDNLFSSKTLVTSADISKELTTWLNTQEANITANPDALESMEALRNHLSTLTQANSALYKSLLHSPTFSVEYSLDRQPMVQAAATSTSSTTTTTSALMNTPDLHTVRLIQSYGYLTLNESASFFGQKTTTMPDSWRDLQIGARVDIPFSGITNLVDKGTFTLSGLFVDLHQMPLGINLMVNGVSVTQPGKIGLFQAKYSIPLKSGSGAQVPISITYSNRTDLIKESSIQAGIGITFDATKLIASQQASPAQ